MRKILLCALIIFFAGFGVFAGDDGNTFSFDTGGGLTVPFFTAEALEDLWGTTGSGFDVLASILLTKVSLVLDARFCITPSISAGLELGAYLMVFSDPAFYDFPLRAIFRYGGKGTYIELLGGYYISAAELSGFEIGARGSLGGLYVDFTYVIAEYSYYNVGLGWIATNIFGF